MWPLMDAAGMNTQQPPPTTMGEMQQAQDQGQQNNLFASGNSPFAAGQPGHMPL